MTARVFSILEALSSARTCLLLWIPPAVPGEGLYTRGETDQEVNLELTLPFTLYLLRSVVIGKDVSATVDTAGGSG